MVHMGHSWDGIFILSILKEGDLYVVNEGNYPFLEKIYDSNDSDMTTKYLR
jgi:hypothetical protein